jgi:hypothetical protein
VARSVQVASRIASRVLCAVHFAPRIASFAPRFVLRVSSIAFPASRPLHPASTRKIIEIESKLLIRLRRRWETGSLNEVGKK